MAESYKNIVEAANGSPSKTSTRKCYSEGYQYNNGPIIISEYGGVAYDIDNTNSKEALGDMEKD